MVYKPATVDFTEKQIHQMVKGQPIRLSHSQIGKGKQVILLHPENHNKLSKAYQSGRGCNLHIADGELAATHHSNMDGTGFFDSVWKFLKNNATPLLDIVQNVAKPIVGEDIANAGRDLARSVTGKGIKKRVSRKTNSLHGGSMFMPHQ